MFVPQEGIHPGTDNVHVIEDFAMLETFTQVCTFCGLAGHNQCFFRGFTHIVRPPYDILGKEVKMGLVQLPPKGTGGGEDPEGQDPVCPHVGVPRFQQTIPLGDRHFQGRVGSSAISKAI